MCNVLFLNFIKKVPEKKETLNNYIPHYTHKMSSDVYFDNINASLKTNNEIKLEKNENENTIPNEICDSYSHTQEAIKPDLNSPEAVEKLENNLISKILKISFEEKENFFYLSNLKAQFESLDKKLIFKLDELDEYFLELINHPEINNSIIDHFLIFFSRAYTMLEVKHKDELDPKYQIIRKSIASYLGLIISNPENFGLLINEQKLIKNFVDFYNDSEKMEFDFLISDLVNSLSDDFDGLKKVFSYYIFGIFHDMNLKSESNFYQNEKVKNNLNTIIRMLNDHVILRKLYTESKLFRMPMLDGKTYQMNTLLGYYFNLVSFECNNQSLIKSAFGSISLVNIITIKIIIFHIQKFLNFIH
jgi:hypothetical protein